MLSINNKGTLVKVKIEADSSIDRRFYSLDIDTGSELYAELLAKNLSGHLEKLLTTAREKAYNAGWKDAKAKKPKKNRFNRYIKDSEFVGWKE